MSLTQFSMVEELASLVKDNLPSKYLILAVEDALVNFLHDDISSDAVLELEPMNSYNRLLVHRLADIFGFAHQSIGEGEDRHLVLECCPETSMPGILVSDFLLQPGESQPPMIFDVLRRKDVTAGQSIDVVGGSSLEERKATYFAARERIFSANACGSQLIKKRPQKDPAVARRMITHALGQPNNKVIKHDLSSCDAEEYGQTANGVKTLYVDESDINSSNKLETESLSAKHPRPCTMSKVNKDSEFKVNKQPQQKYKVTLTEGGSTVETRSNDNSLRKEHIGAAKRLFANALGVNRRDVNPPKCCETKKTDC
ncbi:hypothetical protein ACS0TY_009196 [Phlomoides rotata]